MHSHLNFRRKLSNKPVLRAMLIFTLALASAAQARADEHDVSDAEFLTFNLDNPEQDAATALAS